MSIFEIIMLISFGAAWPFSIYRSYTSRSIAGKSPFFILVIMIGYVSGILNKIFYDFDGVIYLYALNLAMSTADFLLYVRNYNILKNEQKIKDGLIN